MKLESDIEPDIEPDIELQNALKEDLQLIVNLLKDSNLPHEDVPSKLDCMFIAYTTSNEVVGIGGVEIYGEYGLLRSLVVKEGLRGKGYGKRLCLKLMERAKQKGVKEVYLLTTTARTFFEKLGFSVIQRSEVPEVIRKTDEFSSLCPSTAVCMMRRI